ncbi:MAG: hypothetical protein KDB47_00185 [Mycobacterium sp.]|jgi:hypothetical protein|nr:hypothetical protein [Mycobacterium sp.]
MTITAILTAINVPAHRPGPNTPATTMDTIAFFRDGQPLSEAVCPVEAITVESSESPESYEAALLAAGWEIIGDDPGFGNGGWVVRQIDSPLDGRQDADIIRAWLGPVELTADELARLLPVWDAAEDDGTETLSATVQYLVGDTSPEEAGQRLLTATRQRQDAVAFATQVARLAAEDGVTEVELARRIGVDRANTLRRWLGK